MQRFGPREQKYQEMSCAEFLFNCYKDKNSGLTEEKKVVNALIKLGAIESHKTISDFCCEATKFIKEIYKFVPKAKKKDFEAIIEIEEQEKGVKLQKLYRDAIESIPAKKRSEYAKILDLKILIKALITEVIK